MTIVLLLCSLVAAIGNAQYLYGLASSTASLQFTVTVGASTLATTCVLLYALFAGHVWARLLFLFFLAMQMLRLLAMLAVSTLAVTILPGSQGLSLSGQLTLGAQLALSATVFAVLRSQSVREWYRRSDR